MMHEGDVMAAAVPMLSTTAVTPSGFYARWRGRWLPTIRRGISADGRTWTLSVPAGDDVPGGFDAAGGVFGSAASGTVDATYELTLDQVSLAQSVNGAQIKSVGTAQTICCRMQVDAEPFKDKRVRQAVVKGVDNAAIQKLVFPEGGNPAYNFHVAPVHPEFFPLPELARDVEGAKALLKEAGHENGLALSIDVGNTDGPWHQAVCEAIRDQLQEVGIKLTVNVLPTTRFWEIWNLTPFGATSWAHRPIGTMALSQAYRTGVPWNESHFSDPAFDAALAEAEGTIDVEKRKAKMEQIEKILQDAAVMVQPLWRPVYNLAAANVHGLEPHPARVMQLNRVWMS